MSAAPPKTTTSQIPIELGDLEVMTSSDAKAFSKQLVVHDKGQLAGKDAAAASKALQTGSEKKRQRIDAGKEAIRPDTKMNDL